MCSHFLPLCVCVCVFQVCDLLDLLGGSEETLQPGPAVDCLVSGLSVHAAGTAGGDLLDLLGGFEPAELSPGEPLSVTHTHTHTSLGRQRPQRGNDFEDETKFVHCIKFTA